MFRAKRGFGGAWRGLNLFISHLRPGIQGNISMRNSQKFGVLNSVKVELLDLPATHSRLGPCLRVKGEISGDEDLLVEGTVDGSICLNEKKLVIGATANLTADVIAEAVLVKGNVNGNVRASGWIEVDEGGSVIGHLTTPQVFISNGARFKGTIKIGKSEEPETDEVIAPETKPAPGQFAVAAGASDI
jgi:cytoskeletal protein CcmA (bactofilin family)